MEGSSHELIEQLISQEKYCYSFDSTKPVTGTSLPESQEQQQSPPTTTSTQTNDENASSIESENEILSSTRKSTEMITHTVIQQETRKVTTSSGSSSELPSHNQKWTEQESMLLADAVRLYGYGHWKNIAEHVKTRNALQCKNHARQKYADPLKKKVVKSSASNIVSPEPEVETRILGLPGTDLIMTEKITETTVIGSTHVINHNFEPLDQAKATGEEGAMIPTTVESNIVNEEKNTQQENELDLNVITDHERKSNVEWFQGKPAKTPERYMRIRNHIINCWKGCRPTYLTKLAGRKNLADCGDVNAVGRIHSYLESTNVINANAVNTVRRVYGRRSENGAPAIKKTKKAPSYYWANVEGSDEEELPRSDIIKGDGKSRPKRVVKKPETFYNEGRNDSGHSDDPFTLVPVNFYPSGKNAPFVVNVTSEALLVMDFHSHLAYTEIIGLLGGRFVKNEETGVSVLNVEYVFPCHSNSTGTQCEMDPASEMAARELFEEKGISVVGWYHSHPTFEPEPSIRDIENQASYQDLFRDETLGVEPFIGVIITPFNSRNIVYDRSQIQFVHISKKRSLNNHYRLPFACTHKVTPCKIISDETIEIIKALILEYKYHEHKIDMSLHYGEILRLDKLINSVRKHLFMDQTAIEQFLANLKNTIQKLYIEQSNDDNTIHEVKLLPRETNQIDGVITSLAI